VQYKEHVEGTDEQWLSSRL